MNEPIERLLLRPTEVADTIGLGRSKTYALIASGEIPSIRIGKSIRVSTKVLRRWVEEHFNKKQKAKVTKGTRKEGPLFDQE